MAGDENEKIENKESENENKEEVDEEYRIQNHPPAPYVPTKQEWIEHQITHVPYKSWCPICVKNAAVNNPGAIIKKGTMTNNCLYQIAHKSKYP